METSGETMKKIFRQLAKKAGFVFWSEEDTWGPGPKHIDWASNYDHEIEQFAKLIVKECVDQLDVTETVYREKILNHFKIKQ